MKSNTDIIFLNESLRQNSEIIISYITEGSTVHIINRMYTRYFYSSYEPYNLFVIDKAKAESLRDGTLCTINVLSLKESNFRAKLFRINKSNYEKICGELTKYYQYATPESSFEVFEVIVIKEI